MLRTIGRMIWATIAFVLSGVVALAVIVLLGYEKVAATLSDGELGEASEIGRWIGFLDQASTMFDMVAGVSMVPALLAVIVGEVARIRSALYWVPAGGLAIAAAPFLLRLSSPATTGALPSTALLQLLATAGFAAGLVYWLLAGRLLRDDRR